MGIASPDKETFTDSREHPRLRVPIPFACSFARIGVSRWATKNRTGLGVVYDLSMKGARVSSEASISPGDQVMVILRLPKQAAPLTVESATVRWAKDQTFGLEFMSLTFSSELRLKKFFALHTKLSLERPRHSASPRSN